MSRKIELFICPFCLSAENIESLDSGIEDYCGYEKLRCCECNIEWEENFTLTYCGYNITNEKGETIIYNKLGEEV